MYFRVDKDFPGMLQDPKRFWSMGQTSVDVEFGERAKSFTASLSHYGRFNPVAQGGNRKHVTAVIAVSASGLIAPRFFIVAGKNLIMRWFKPFDKNEIDFSSSEMNALNETGWFLGDGYVGCIENGSMEMNIMPLFVAHLDRYVRTFVPPTKEYLFCLNGHASREGVKCLCACIDRKCQAVQSPANTTQVLQPCDQDDNARFNTAVRKTRDKLCPMGFSEICSLRAKLMCAVRGLQSFTVKDIRDSFSKTGLWPIKFDFAKRFRTTADVHREHAASLKDKSAGTSAVPLRALKRTEDSSTALEIWNVMNQNIGPSRKLQEVQIKLKRSQIVNDVLMGVGPDVVSRRSSVGGNEVHGGKESNCGNEIGGAEREKKLKDVQEPQAERARIAEGRKNFD